MILDARQGHVDFFVFDVKRMLVPRCVVWVNDETAQWGQIVEPMTVFNDELNTVRRQEDRITIYLERKLILFNEVDDQEPAAQEAQHVLHAG
jgi:hypothetical protein